MTQTDVWMPIFVGDYIAKTQCLDAEESGCYLLLLMNSWITGPLPNDHKKLMRMARLHGEVKKIVLEEILTEHFELTADGYINSRLEKERIKARNRSDAARENGLKGGRPRKLPVSHSLPIDNPTPNPEKSSSPSPSHSSSYTQSEEKERESAKRFTPPTLDEVKAYGMEYSGTRFTDAERFVDFYASKGWLVGKAKMKDWKAAVRNWTRKDSSPTDAKETETAQRRREEERQAIAAEKAGVEIPSVMGAIFKAKKGATV